MYLCMVFLSYITGSNVTLSCLGNGDVVGLLVRDSGGRHIPRGEHSHSHLAELGHEVIRWAIATGGHDVRMVVVISLLDLISVQQKQ